MALASSDNVRDPFSSDSSSGGSDLANIFNAVGNVLEGGADLLGVLTGKDKPKPVTALPPPAPRAGMDSSTLLLVGGAVVLVYVLTRN